MNLNRTLVPILVLALGWMLSGEVQGKADKNDPTDSPSPVPSIGPSPSPLPFGYHYALPKEDFSKIRRPFPNFNKLKYPEFTLGPVIASLSGVKTLSVRASDGSVYPAEYGYFLGYGDSFLTGESGFVRVAYEQGAHVIISPNSHVKVGIEPNEFGGNPVSTLFLYSGEIRVLVEKAKEDDENSSHHRFFVRTPNSAIGVRGTDFLVFSKGQTTQIYTVSGVVDVSSDTKSMNRGKYETATEGFYIRAYKDTLGLGGTDTIDRPRVFLVGGFLKEFHEKYPKFESMWQKSIQDGKTRRVVKLFENYRQGMVQGDKAKSDQVKSDQLTRSETRKLRIHGESFKKRMGKHRHH